MSGMSDWEVLTTSARPVETRPSRQSLHIATTRTRTSSSRHRLDRLDRLVLPVGRSRIYPD
eukprot:652528-Amorphochlora_amoeboformis.AAC.1